MLQRPHRVATVGVVLHVRTGVGRADHHARLPELRGHAVVVGIRHCGRDLGLEVVGEREVEEHVDRMSAALGREIARSTGPRTSGCAGEYRRNTCSQRPENTGVERMRSPSSRTVPRAVGIGGEPAHAVGTAVAHGSRPGRAANG